MINKSIALINSIPVPNIHLDEFEQASKHEQHTGVFSHPFVMEIKIWRAAREKVVRACADSTALDPAVLPNSMTWGYDKSIKPNVMLQHTYQLL